MKTHEIVIMTVITITVFGLGFAIDKHQDKEIDSLRGQLYILQEKQLGTQSDINTLAESANTTSKNMVTISENFQYIGDQLNRITNLDEPLLYKESK